MKASSDSTDSLESSTHSSRTDIGEREIERYGAYNISKCETFFYEDSKSVLKYIETNPTELDMIVQTILWINHLLLSLGMSMQERMSFVSEMRQRYLNEFNLSSEQIRTIDRTLRSIKENIISNIVNHAVPSSLEDSNNKWINEHHNPDNLLSSLIHMHINRLFNMNQRLYEYIVYHMFSKTLDSVLKRFP